MQPVPSTPEQALAIYRDPQSEEWERDHAACMIGALDAGMAELRGTACDPTASEALQQRAAECLANAWRDRGMLETGDIGGFTPCALQEMLFQRGEGPPAGRDA